jgi:DNA replication factor GINS
MQPMTFEELSQIHREEMKGRYLTPCRPDLYKAMADLLNRLRLEYDRQLAIDPDSVMSEGANLRRKNAESISKVVISLRTKKICNKAVLSADGANEQLDALTPEEREFYYQIVDVSRRHMSTVDRLRGKKTVDTRIDEIVRHEVPVSIPKPEETVPEEPPKKAQEPAAAEDDFPPMPDVPEMFDDPMEETFDDIPEPEEEAPQQPVEAEPEPVVPTARMETTLLRILEDLPPFVGPNRNYELHKEDIVTLPTPMAKALINSNKAVAVNPGP